MHETDDRRIARFRRPLGWLLACYWAGLFALTHTPLPDISVLPRHTDKVAHLVTYGGLAFLLTLWWSTHRTVGVRQLGKVLMVLAVYSVIDELLQIPVNRTADIYDVCADMVGVTIGLTAFLLTRRLLPSWWDLVTEDD